MRMFHEICRVRCKIIGELLSAVENPPRQRRRTPPGARLRTAVRTICGALAFAGLSTASAQRAGDILTVAHVQTLPDNEIIYGERGLIFVPENRSRHASRLIAVAFVRFPSTSENPGAPIFWLPGGPGDSAARRFANGAFDDRFVQEEVMLLEDMRAAGDVIIVDQRGTGLSWPFLLCSNQNEPALDPQQLIKRRSLFNNAKASAAKCKDEWKSLGHDVDGYHIFDLVDDVKALSDALGYKKIVLYGGSFGSQWSLSIMRRHPDLVARALLRGVEDTNDTLDSPDALLVAIETILADAAKDADIAPLIPVGGFVNAIRQKIEDLEQNPSNVTITDPVTGEPIEVPFGAEELRSTWWRDPDGWRLGERLGGLKWPGSLAKVVDGDFSDLALMIHLSKVTQTASMTSPSALYTAVDCSLAGPKKIRDAYASAEATALIGDPNISLTGACAGWKAPKTDDAFFESLMTEVPTLVFHGTVDMATPFENAHNTLPGFQNGRLITVEMSGHNPLTDVYKERPQMIRPIVREFLRTGYLEDAPESISLPPLDYKAPARQKPGNEQ